MLGTVEPDTIVSRDTNNLVPYAVFMADNMA